MSASGALWQNRRTILAGDNILATLTDKERDILTLLGDGWTPKAIARELGIRPGTLRKILWRARDRHGCTTIVELAVKVVTTQADTE